MTGVRVVDEQQLRETIFTLLAQIAPESDPSTLAVDEDMRLALDIDSFDFLNFLIALNEAVGVEVPESDYGQVGTIEGLLRYLRERLP